MTGCSPGIEEVRRETLFEHQDEQPQSARRSQHRLGTDQTGALPVADDYGVVLVYFHVPAIEAPTFWTNTEAF